MTMPQRGAAVKPLTIHQRNVRETAVKMRVRKFEVGDLDQVLVLADRYASWDTTPTRADIEGFHSANPDFFFVAEFNKKIVGFVYGRESSPPAETLDKWKSRKVASIETLGVDEDYRRRGIATSLLTALFEAFKQKGTDLVTLSVPAAGLAAIKLYGKMGFEPRAHFLWKRLDA
jgi:ribosomal protein S18 acetylase RimI-like enzyme